MVIKKLLIYLLIFLLIIYLLIINVLQVSYINEIKSIKTRNYSKYSGIDADLIIERINEYKYIIKPLHIHKYIALTIYGITSRCDSFYRRMMIRNTIVKYSKYYKSKVFFFIGKSYNARFNKLLKKEALLFNDIVQISFYESYFNLTILSLYMIRWIINNCIFVYIVKNDQDVVPNMKLLYNFLNSAKNSKCSYGIVSNKEKVCRKKNSTTYIPYSSYNNSVLPKYIYGFFAIYNYKLLKEINVISFSTHPIIYKEDVHIGFLASKSNYSFCRMSLNIVDIKKLLKKNNICKTVAIHRVDDNI